MSNAPADPDPLIPVRQVRARVSWFPDVSRFTLGRWIRDGVKAPDGTRVRCKATKAGSTWYVRPSWLRTFLDALTTQPAAAAKVDAGQADADADAVLAADGI